MCVNGNPPQTIGKSRCANFERKKKLRPLPPSLPPSLSLIAPYSWLVKHRVVIGGCLKASLRLKREFHTLTAASDGLYSKTPPPSHYYMYVYTVPLREREQGFLFHERKVRRLVTACIVVVPQPACVGTEHSISTGDDFGPLVHTSQTALGLPRCSSDQSWGSSVQIKF